MWKKLLLSLTLPFVFLLCIALVLEGGARLYILIAGDGVLIPNDSPRGFRIPKPFVNAQYRLTTDWSWFPKTNFQNESKRMVEQEGAPNFWMIHNDVTVMKRNVQNGRVRVLNKKTKEVIYDTTYSTDSDGRRVVPLSSGAGTFEKHLIVSGCSFIFGLGLNDDETLPAELQKLMPRTRVYNLGRMGGSVVDAIAQITRSTEWDHVEPKEGIVLVSFQAVMHIGRLLGTSKIVGKWHDKGAMLKEDPATGRAVYAGTFEQNARVWVLLSKVLARSKFLTLIGFDWPIVTRNAFAQYAKALDDLRSYYRERYNRKNNIIVLIPPLSKESLGIVEFLEERKIPYMDYSAFSIDQYVNVPEFIPYDGHPSHEYNRVWAQLIRRDLENPQNQALLDRSH